MNSLPHTDTFFTVKYNVLYIHVIQMSNRKSVEEMLAPYRTLAPFLRGDPVRQLAEVHKEILHTGQIQGL